MESHLSQRTRKMGLPADSFAHLHLVIPNRAKSPVRNLLSAYATTTVGAP